jgi:hypothetical protein
MRGIGIVADLKGLELGKLPNMLTSFQISGKYLPWTTLAFDIGVVLPNLLNLDIPVHIESEMADWFAKIPPTLQSLKVDEIDDWLPLPVGLTQLCIRDHCHAPPSSMRFPPNFRHLELKCWDTDFVQQISLPSTLEILIIEVRGFVPYTHALGTLPESLSTLELRELLIFDKPLLLPSHLTNVTLHGVSSINAILALPATVKDLTLNDFIPAGLGNPSFQQVDPSAFFSALPRYLRRLMITCRQDYGEWRGMVDYGQNEGWQIAGKVEIPEKLEFFSTSGCLFTAASLNAIPPSIHDTQISSIDAHIDSLPNWRVLKQLRSSCFPIKFVVLQQLSQDCPLIEHIYLQAEFSDTFKPTLSIPPTGCSGEKPLRFVSRVLKHLELLGDMDWNFEDSFLHGLPLSLSLFSIGNDHGITDLGIKNLQKCHNLEILSLPNASLITGNCFKWLPRSLTSIYAPESTEVDDVHISDLPRSLLRLVLNGASQLTNEGMKHLPPSIYKVSIGSNSKITSEVFPHLPRSLRGEDAIFRTEKLLMERGVVSSLRNTAMHRDY